MTDNLMRMIPTHELPQLVASFEAHALRNFERGTAGTEPDWVVDWSMRQAASWKAEADRVQTYYLRRLAHERSSALG